MSLASIVLMMLLGAEPGNPTAPASVGGVVVMAETNVPVEHAVVRLLPISEESPFPLKSSRIESWQKPVKADKNGRFVFAKVPPGAYRIVVNRTTSFVSGPLHENSIHANPGESLRDLRIEVTPAASISGRIVDSHGKAAAGAVVRAITASYENGRRILGPSRFGVGIVSTALANNRGEYRIDGLRPGQYFLSANSSSNSIGSATLGFGGYGIGGFLGSGGPAWCDANLPAVNSLGISSLPAIVAGPTRAPSFFPGVRDPSEAVAINVKASVPLDHADFRVEDPSESRTTSIKGVVIDAALEKRAENVEVWITPVDGGSDTCLLQSKNGSFETVNMRPGIYIVSANIETPSRLAGRTIVDTTRNLARNVTIPVAPLFHIHGHIVVDGNSPAAGTPDLSSYFVSLQSEPAVNSARLTYAAVARDGTFDIQSLMGWDYRVSLRTPEPDTYVQSIRLGSADVLSSGFRLENQPDADLEIVIRRDSGAVAGVMSTAAAAARSPGDPMRVVLVPDSGQRFRPDSYRVVALNQKGEFEMAGIAPGTYKLFAWQEVTDGAWSDPQFLRLYEDQGTPVCVSSGETAFATIKPIAPWK